MQGQPSYLWEKSSPSIPIYRILSDLCLSFPLVFGGMMGCGESRPEKASNPVAREENPAQETERPSVAVGGDFDSAKAQAAEGKAEEDSASRIPEETRTEGSVDESPVEETEPQEDVEGTGNKDEEPEELVEPIPLPAPEDATRLSPTEEVWIKRNEHKVIVGGQVALRRGMLEMFACPKGTKEHESVVAVNAKAATVHAALLAVGAIPGTPVSYDTEYHPPTGTEIAITVEWKDPDGKWHSADAREWVRNVRTEKQLDVPWVFAGSGFYVDEETKKQHYLAESGDLICVSNFSSATLDLPVESSQAEAGLLFEAFTDRVPALGTPVRLTLTPKLESSGRDTSPAEEQK